jgi:hypothetical protein
MIFTRLFTKNLKSIPLLYINFNYQHFIKKGKKDSCILNLHPSFRKDEHIIATMNGLVSYIRDNYDMNKII